MVDHELLESLSFFSELTDTEFLAVRPLCNEIHGQAGDCIIKEGEPVRNLYILVSGQVAILKRRADGKQLALATVGKGEVLGELTFLKFTPAFATVEAKEPFTALAIDQSELQRLLDSETCIGAKLYKKLARITGRRLRTITSQFIGP
ncbi:MAG: cyclic nucleotide-binding domain-containing protein [Nitrospirota bacterium]